MKQNETSLMPKQLKHFECVKCKFICSKQSNYSKHLLTAKHNKPVIETSETIKTADTSVPTFICELCNLRVKSRTTLWRHKKTCSGINIAYSNQEHKQITEVPPPVDSSLVLELLKQNQEFKDMMIDQHKRMTEQQQRMIEQQDTILELSKNVGNTTNNTTNKFNLNFFLNETCKDAITINEFINSIEVSMDDFIRTGNIGFVNGISKVMVERIKDMEMHTRPLHCTDLKRETMYIKNEERWEKEDTDKTQLRKAVKNVANKNYKQLQKWYDRSKPAVEQIGSEECEDYFKYYKASLGGYDKEEDKKFEEKIIRNVLKEVVVEK